MNIAKLCELGQTFGERALSMISTMDAYIDEAGIGSNWRDLCAQFEGALDGYADFVAAKCPHDAARDLFEAEARLAFYGVNVDRATAQRWRFARSAAIQELEQELRTGAAA